MKVRRGIEFFASGMICHCRFSVQPMIGFLRAGLAVNECSYQNDRKEPDGTAGYWNIVQNERETTQIAGQRMRDSQGHRWLSLPSPVNIPQQSWGLYVVSRSKRLERGR
jgi:hypothetical protein